MIIIPGIYNAQTHIPGGNVQGQVITVGAILKVTERDRRPYPSDPGVPSEIWIDNTGAIGYVCKEIGPNGTVWDRLDVLGDYIAFGDNDPGVNADITWGYRPGSLRYARNSEILWVCKDNTQGAAVWNVLSSGGSVVSVNGQTGVVQLYLDDLLDVDAPLPTNGDVLTWDSATSTWIALAPTGGGGTYTVNNGLSPQTTPSANPNNFQLGGPLIQNTIITQNAFTLTFNQNNFGSPSIQINQLGTFGIGIRADVLSGTGFQAFTTSGNGVLGQSTSNGFGGQFISSSGYGLRASTLTGPAAIYGFASGNTYAGFFQRQQGGNVNSTTPVLKIRRNQDSPASIPLSGYGASIEFFLGYDGDAGGETLSNIIKSIWTNPVLVSKTSQFEIDGFNNNIQSRLLALAGNGQLILDKYNSTTFVASPSYALGVDASGNVVQFTPGGGPPITYTADNGITETANNFQLGGPLVLNTVISGATRAYGIDFSELSYITGTTDQLNVVADNGTDNTQLDISGGGGQIIHTNTVAGSQSAVLLQSSTAALQQISAASGGSIQFTSAFGLFGYYHTPVLTQVQYQVEINSVGIHIVTPNVQASTASVGQVLTLQNATTGQVEFQTPTTSGDNISPFLLMGG
jgi:hypothetical protein